MCRKSRYLNFLCQVALHKEHDQFRSCLPYVATGTRIRFPVFLETKQSKKAESLYKKMWYLPPVNDLTLRVAINNNNNKKSMTVTMTSLCAFSWKKYCNLMNFFFPRNHQKDTPKKGKKNLSFGDVTQIERSKYLGHFCDFLRQCLPFFLCDLDVGLKKKI